MSIRSVNKTEIVRVKKDRNYTTINNTCLRDDRLSWKAKGIMAYLLTLPDDWNIYLEEVMTHAPDGEKSFRSGLKELKDCGYVERVQIREGNKIVGWHTIVNEVPENVDNSLFARKVDVQNVDVQKLHVQNEGLLSTYNTNNLKELNTNNTKDIKNISEVATQTSQVEKVDLIHEQALRVFDLYVGITKSKIKPSAAHLKEVKGRLKDKVITEQECYEIIKFKHAECVRSGNFKYFTLVSMFRASNVPNTLQAIELMKNGMGMEFKDRNNFNKGHQPYVSPSHQAPQQKELIQILEEELPF